MASVETAGFTGLPIGLADAMAAGTLPAHHRDPFDRMLTRRPWSELTIITRDAHFALYGVRVLPT